jgi:hypothetical protein
VREAIQGGTPRDGLPTKARRELAAAAEELSRGREPDLSHLEGHSFFDPDTNRSYYQDRETNRLRAFDPGDYVTTYDPKRNMTSILRHDEASDAVESVPFGQGDNRLRGSAAPPRPLQREVPSTRAGSARSRAP